MRMWLEDWWRKAVIGRRDSKLEVWNIIHALTF